MAVSALKRSVSIQTLKRLTRIGASIDAPRAVVTTSVSKMKRVGIGARHRKLLTARGQFTVG